MATATEELFEAAEQLIRAYGDVQNTWVRLRAALGPTDGRVEAAAIYIALRAMMKAFTLEGVIEQDMLDVFNAVSDRITIVSAPISAALPAGRA